MEDGKYELNIMADPRLPFRINGGRTTRRGGTPNWHENTEVLYCVSGSGYFRCNARNYAVSAGDMVIANSEMLHDVSTDDSMEFRCLILDRHFCMENGIPTTKLTFQEFIHDPALADAMLRIYEVNGRYKQNGNFYEIAAIRAAVLEFLYLLCRDYIIQQTHTAAPHRGELVKTAVIYIRKHLAAPLTLDEIAEKFGVDVEKLKIKK